MKAEGEEAISLLGPLSIKAGFIAWIIFLISSPLLSKVIGTSLKLLIVFSFVFPLAYFLAVMIGSIQGEQRFKHYAYYEIFGSIAKFSTLTLILFTSLSVTAAISGTVMEILIGCTLLYILTKPLNLKGGFKNNKLIFKSFIFILAVHSAFSIDIMFLKIFKSAEIVGVYNSVSVIGKAVFFSSIAINRTVFPKFVEKSGSKIRKLLHISVSLIFIGGTSAYLFFKFFGGIFLELSFGASYISASEFAPAYMIFISTVSLVALAGNFYLSSDKKSILKIIIMPIIQIIGLFFFHESVMQVIYVGIISASTTFLIMYLPVIKSDLKNIKQS